MTRIKTHCLLPAACCLLPAVCCLLLAGCGEAGPARYDVSGSVTYDGKPLPAGRISFEPDESQGNTGSVGFADVKDGHYQTQPGQGPGGGPYKAVIFGYDGVPDAVEPDENPMGKPLFGPFTTGVDLPRQSATQDFAVPAGGVQ